MLLAGAYSYLVLNHFGFIRLIPSLALALAYLAASFICGICVVSYCSIELARSGDSLRRTETKLLLLISVVWLILFLRVVVRRLG